MPNTYINATTRPSKYPIKRLMVKSCAEVDKLAAEWAPHMKCDIEFKTKRTRELTYMYVIRFM